MQHKKLKQAGFSVIVAAIALVVIGVIALVIWQVAKTDKPVARQVGTTQTVMLSQLDSTTLAQAKELKKVDFDLDGVSNSQDNDDDNDGQNDDVDKDDDNDDINDDNDNDNDNDGVDNDKDNEAAQQAELQQPN